MAPRLSIIIPAYNIERYVGDAVASALAQTIRDVEVIVVNDGSTDGTGAVLATFSDPRLKVVTQPNGGLAHARNTGLRNATAPYIGFLDGDDRWHPEKAARHLELMERDPEIGLTFCHSRYIDEIGEPTGEILVAAPERPTILDIALRNMVGNGSTPVVRADCFTRVGLFNEALLSWEDWEMWLRILRDSGCSLVLIPEVLTDYRIHGLSLMHNYHFYMKNAEFSSKLITRESPMIPKAYMSRGLAQCYRVIGSKAAKLGDYRTTLQLFAKAIGHYPMIVFRDPKLVATLAFMIAPRRVVRLGHDLKRRFARLGPAHRMD